MGKEKRINTLENVKYTGLKTVVKKNFYAIAFDSKLKKDVIKHFSNSTKLEAKNEAEKWASREKLKLKGVYFNS